MALQINKQNYTSLIEKDLEIVNKYIPDGLEKDHIKLVLCDSIDKYYPTPKTTPPHNK